MPFPEGGGIAWNWVVSSKSSNDPIPIDGGLFFTGCGMGWGWPWKRSNEKLFWTGCWTGCWNTIGWLTGSLVAESPNKSKISPPVFFGSYFFSGSGLKSMSNRFSYFLEAFFSTFLTGSSKSKNSIWALFLGLTFC